MLDVGQPGELPLMRELTTLKRAPSLRDPSTVSNWKSPVSGVPSLLNPSCKSPTRGCTGKTVERDRMSVRARNGAASRSSQWSEFLHESDGRSTWRTRMDGAVVLENVREDEGIFDGGWGEAASALFKGGESQRNHARDCHGEPVSLQDSRNPRWAVDVDRIVMAEAARTREWIQRQNRSKPASTRGRHVAHSRDVFDFETKTDAKKRLSTDQIGKKRFQNKTSRKAIGSESNALILSPLVLNSLEDIQYPGHSLSLFSLEGSYNDQHELPNRGPKAGLGGTRGSPNVASRSQSSFSVKNMTRSGLLESVKNRRSQQILTSSTSTSQRTVSQASMPGTSEAASNQLDDELDVSDLPKNGCGLPCYWSKSQKRGRTLLDLAGRSFSCGLSDSSRRKRNSSSKLDPEAQRELAGYTADRPAPSLDLENMEATPLLTEASVASEDVVCSSADDSDRLSSDLNGELGLDSGSAVKRLHGGVSEGQDKSRLNISSAEGKELAIFVERPRSLSQKYRPKLFKDLVGQNLVANALSNAICKGKIAPVYLFQGSRGTGKTSAARMFAAALNCVTLEEWRRPCGACNECLELASGKSLDVKEVDAASNSGIERVKDLLQSTLAAPSHSRYKVFIVDECHMLTNETWNGLLKLLEEPPGNAVFILITTDPDKLPRTAASRCQKFPFPKIKDSDIVSRLQNLAKLENLDVEPGALDLIASRSDGSLRDAEMILDQLSLLGQKISSSTIHELVGSVSDDRLLSLLDLALSADTISTVQRARELVDSGVEPLDLMSQLATLITDILAGGYELPNRNEKGGFFSSHALSEEGLERLRMALQILSEAEKQLRAASTDRTTWLTAALLQLGPDRSHMLRVSSSNTSVTESPIGQSNNARKILKSVAMNGQNQTKKRGRLKGQSSSSEKKPHILSFKGRHRPTKTGLEARIHPADQSFRHDAASRDPSIEDSFVESSVSNEGSERPASFVGPGNLENIWCNFLKRCKSPRLRKFLHSHGKLLTVSISSVDAVVHLEFGNAEHKSRVERSRKSIADAFQKVLSIPIEVRLSLPSLPAGAEGLSSRAMVDQTAFIQGGHSYSSNSSRADNMFQPVENSVEVGSFHYWRSQGGSTIQNTVGQTGSPHSFPAVLTFPNLADPLLSGRCPNDSSVFRGGTQFGQKVDKAASEEERLESGQIYETGRFSPFHESEWQIQHEAQTQEIVLEDAHVMMKDDKMMLDQLDNESAHDIDANNGLCTFHGDRSPHACDIEEENFRLESQMKYGGLLCWKAPKEVDKVSKEYHRRKCGILIRLMPCANSKVC